MGAFQFFLQFQFFFFFFGKRFFFFFFGVFPSFFLFLRLLDRILAGGVKASVLAIVCGGFVPGGEKDIPYPPSRPRDHAVEDRVGVAGCRVGGTDIRVIAAKAVLVACFGARPLIVGAVASGPPCVQANGGSRRSHQVEDRSHSLLKGVLRNEQLQLFLDLFIRDTHRRVFFFHQRSDQIRRIHRIGVFAFRRGIAVGIRIRPHKGRPVESVLIGGVGVLSVNREDARERAAGGAHALEEDVGEFLPVTVVVVCGIPEDGVGFVGAHDRITAWIGKLIRFLKGGIEGRATRLKSHACRANFRDDRTGGGGGDRYQRAEHSGEGKDQTQGTATY